MIENDPLSNANAKIEKLESVASTEIKDYAKEIKKTKLDFMDNKPFIPKIIFLITGFFNYWVGFSLFFIFKTDEKHKWTCNYFLIGSIIGAIYALIKFIFLL